MSKIAPRKNTQFTVAVVPDTQNYSNHRHQRELGFPLNTREMLWDMMQHIARNSVKNGGSIAFATGLGDMWQHPISQDIDDEHAARGDKAVANPLIEGLIPASPEYVLDIEIPAVKMAYKILDGQLPFSVVPGNHDHDHLWTDANHPPRPDAHLGDSKIYGVGGLHIGQLTNWIATFGADTPFFRDKPWYVSSYRGGANSAQVFNGGGYRFLHLGLEMSPHTDVIEWAESVLAKYKGLPTIISIHEFIDGEGNRESLDCLDLSRLDPDRHNPQRLWDRFVSRHDQIFAVLNGHFHGCRHRIDSNQFGHPVYQFLTNYQTRKQSVTGSVPAVTGSVPDILDGIGDGWIRMMEFDLAADQPRLRLRAYSTYFKAYSTELPHYASWYASEHPDLSPEALAALDEFELALDGFHDRFTLARINTPTPTSSCLTAEV